MKSSKVLFTFFLILILLFSCSTNRELIKTKLTYSISDVIKMAEWRFNYNLENQKLCELYILDGVPYNHNEIDSILLKYDKRDIRMISFLNKPKENTWWNKNCDLIPQIQTTLIEQKRKYKIEVLNRIIDVYSKYEKEFKPAGTSCKYCPLVIINYRSINNESEVIPLISKLKIKDIDFIADYPTSHKVDYFGPLGKNGVIEIFLNNIK